MSLPWFQVSGSEIADLYDEVVALKKQYQAARDREQSVANKLLGGLSIGATGIGGMILASGLAEQKSASESKTKTGGIVGGVGAAGGIVGDLIINSGKDEKVTAQ